MAARFHIIKGVNLLGEIRGFLASLKSELPEVFAAPRPAPRRMPRPPTGDALHFAERAGHWAERMGVTFKTVRVKRLRSRWGSCSALGNLNFNRRLLEAPPEVLDYVVIHELAHLKEMNHSKSFWRIVSEHCPEHKAHRRWLNAHGGELLRRNH